MSYLNHLKTTIIGLSLMSIISGCPSSELQSDELTPQNIQTYEQSLRNKYDAITFENLVMTQAKSILFALKGATTHHRFKDKLNQWAGVREAEIKLILKLRAIIDFQLKQPFIDNGPPLTNIPSPIPGYSGQIDPELIKDKKLRETYIKAIEENAKYAQYRVIQGQLRDHNKIFYYWSERYITHSYSLPPFDQKLNGILIKGKINDLARLRILESVNKKANKTNPN